MTSEPPLGLEMVSAPGSADVRLYWVKFDKDGVCTSPVTATSAAAAAGLATHVFVMSHGWNNDWGQVGSLYRRWIANLLAIRPATTPGRQPHFAPVFIGVFWPSIVSPGEEGAGPVLAAGPEGPDPTVTAVIEELGDTLTDADRARLVELMGRAELPEDEAAQLAQLLAPLFAGGDAGDGLDEVPGQLTAENANDVLAAWRVAAISAQPSKPEVLDDEPLDEPTDEPTDGDTQQPAPDPADADTTPDPAPAAQPEIAGFFNRLPTVWIGRLASVLVMKDRSGRVGAFGVAELLADVLSHATSAKVHLLAHSYGCKVIMSALCRAGGTAKVDSVLLMQPALSARCFADDAGNGQPGGYRPVLGRTKQAVLTTYSSHDFPLTKAYQFSARRASDLGEVQIAASDDGPSKYAALGGYGPQLTAAGVVTWEQPHLPPSEYPNPGPGHIVAIQGDSIIGGHGDIATPATAWMLAGQLDG